MKTLFRSSLLCAAAALPLAVHAQAAAPPAPEPDYTLSGNLAIGSDYRFRGFSQTDYQPTVQGGVDFAHKSGFYLGNWNSNVSSNLYNGSPIEMDFYGGWKTTIDKFGLDLGVIYYYYPGSGEYNPSFKPKNFEAYVGGSFGPVSLKYFYSFTNFFGLEAPGYNTKGSQYLDLSGNFDIGNGLTLVGHAGYQYVKNYKDIGGPDDNVWDYKLGGTWDIAGSGWILGAFWVGTSEKKFFLTAENPPQGAGKSSFLATIGKTF
jgi:uncharacterized protein (TIGR02001 family)